MIRTRPALSLSLALLVPLAARCAPTPSVGHIVRTGVRASRNTKMKAWAADTLSVDFLPLSDGAKVSGALGLGTVDIGSVSYGGGVAERGVTVKRSQNEFDVVTPVAVKIGSENGDDGTATIKAWLNIPVDPYRIYFDDVPLTSQPMPISPRTQLGVTRHSLRIAIPRTAQGDQAVLRAVISFEVTRN